MNFLDERNLLRILMPQKLDRVAPGDLKRGDVVIDKEWMGAQLVASVTPEDQIDQHGVAHPAFTVLDSFRSGGSYLPDQYVDIVPRDQLDPEVIAGILEDQDRDMAINDMARNMRDGAIDDITRSLKDD